MAITDIARIYETVLSTPGMQDTVKIELRIPRRNVFMLAKVIERGLSEKQDNSSVNVLQITGTETLQDLGKIPEAFLTKAGLMEMNEKLKLLGKD